MSLSHRFSPHRRAAVLAVIALSPVLSAVPAWSDAHTPAHGGASHAAMTDAEMERWVREYYAHHPIRGLSATAFPPAATFRATGTQFDADNNLGTQVDVVNILTGQSVLWQWIDGSHTVTSGSSVSDPNAGALFDSPLNTITRTFTHTFTTAGTYPFHCGPHDFLNMRGTVVVTDPVIDAEVEVRNFLFDADDDLGTQIDTVRVFATHAVRWTWIEGIHTITNGTDDSDPQAGTLFDVPSEAASPTFVQVFPTPGDFPYFCRPHGLLQMQGVVRVLPANQVDVPEPVASAHIGFTVSPRPNPTASGVQFRFRLPEAGRARARVLDARGALVATVLDRTLPAGEHPAAWDGRTRAGTGAVPGVYFVHLELPGYTHSERFVIMR